MRFQQLKRYSNAILKKKMYKSGKNWIVKSTLSLASGLALFGVSQLTTVQADTIDLTPVSQATSESVEQPQNDDKDVNADPTTQPEQTKEDASGQNADVPQEKETPDKDDMTSAIETREPSAKPDEQENPATQPEGTTTQPVTPQENDDVTDDSEPIDTGDWGIDCSLSKDGTTLTINGGTLNKDTSYVQEFDPEFKNNKNPWNTAGIDKDKITKISITKKVVTGKSISGLFADFSNVKQFTGLDKLDTSNTVDMSYLFRKSGNFGEQDLNNWDVSNVENFSDMFLIDDSLKSLDISNWNWIRGSNFEEMFYGAVNLESLILPKNINSTSVSDKSKLVFKYMFARDDILTSLDISNIDMSGIKNNGVDDLFYGDKNLQELTLSPQNCLLNSALEIPIDESLFTGSAPIAVAWIAVKSDDAKVKVNDIKISQRLQNMYNGLSGNRSKVTWKWDYELPMKFKEEFVAEDDHSKVFYTGEEYTQPPYTYFQTHFDASKVPSNISLDDYYAGYDGRVLLTKDDEGVVPIPKKQAIIQVIETNTAGTENKSHTFYIPLGKTDYTGIDYSEELSDLPDNRKMITYSDGVPLSEISYFELIPYPPEEGATVGMGSFILNDPAEYNGVTVSKIESDVRMLIDYYIKVFEASGDTYSGTKYIFHILYEPEENNNFSSGSHSSSSSNEVKPENNEPESINGTLGTYNDSPEVKLYDDSGTELTDRKLAPSSDWFTDETMTLNGDKYYRVATNQWAKADDVYIYHGHAANVLVNADSIASLVTASGKPVTDRALQANSGWYTDRYIYINNDKYYRVATNEFVSADKVQEY
ncbi:BspA family leucine-rich repeat surface protein [Companilactobacillus muriivasis]|uniref:BspA family leucine-rich repeat surface protein n=1 Tax=Companilactobacillus muriivasis TaxID=3081444 RepID=UPI0030C72C40